ncbi:hypothetical protein KI688_004897 [Linnemannia hyalina]|uniref:Uncharacterized protein n=1 Tax=Linnemannia hyalina TaxID=64524 RepID=A0A9P7XJN3_9FUNG|nr:hypothetical protein KI688_004897 [Linnemannia hyalina]
MDNASDDNNNQRETVAISRRLYQERLGAKGLDTVISQLQPLTLESVAEYLNYVIENREAILNLFYSSPWYIRKSWENS